MDLATNLHQDAILHGVTKNTNSESSRQDSQKTCTRNSYCLQPGCSTCATLAPHVRNLNVSLTNTNERTNSAISPTAAEPLQPLINHAISNLTATFQRAIQIKDLDKLKNLRNLYNQTMSTNLDFICYDTTALGIARATAFQIINHHTAPSTPLPASPPN